MLKPSSMTVGPRSCLRQWREEEVVIEPSKLICEGRGRRENSRQKEKKAVKRPRYNKEFTILL